MAKGDAMVEMALSSRSEYARLTYVKSTLRHSDTMARVLLLHTGGTLGMTGSPLKPDAYNSAITDAVPEISELADVDTDIVFNLDSSDIGPEHWAELASRIADARDTYDGFVIVHGTDTMAYTASALAFTLRGLDRPVILTGAQRPLSALRTDARRNLADAVDVATRDIPEVCICFDGLLFRGCRTTKSSSRDYRAFTARVSSHWLGWAWMSTKGLISSSPTATSSSMPGSAPMSPFCTSRPDSAPRSSRR